MKLSHFLLFTGKAREAKLNQVLKNQNTIIQMLSDLLENKPGPGARMDISKIIEPLLDNPIIKSNPVFSKAFEEFKMHMGEKK